MGGFAAEDLLPGEGHHVALGPFDRLCECGTGRIIDGNACAIRGYPVEIRNLDPGGRAILGEDQVRRRSRESEIRQRSIGSADVNAAIGKLQLLHRVGHPLLTEAFPGKHIDRTGAQHGPQRHFHGTRVRRGYDRNLVFDRDAQQRSRAVDRLFELGFPGFGTVRTAEQRTLEGLQTPAWTLFGRTRRESSINRTDARRRYACHQCTPILTDERPPLGADGPPRRIATLTDLSMACGHFLYPRLRRSACAMQ